MTSWINAVRPSIMNHHATCFFIAFVTLKKHSFFTLLLFLFPFSENHLESFRSPPGSLSIEGQIWGKSSMWSYGLKTPRYASCVTFSNYYRSYCWMMLYYFTNIYRGSQLILDHLKSKIIWTFIDQFQRVNSDQTLNFYQ